MEKTAYKIVALKLDPIGQQPDVILELTSDDLDLVLAAADSLRAKIRDERSKATRDMADEDQRKHEEMSRGWDAEAAATTPRPLKDNPQA